MPFFRSAIIGETARLRGAITVVVGQAVSQWLGHDVGLATMLLFHSYGPHPSFMQPSFQETHPMMDMWSDMGWLIVFGPVAMILFLGGTLTLAALLVRYLLKAD